MLEVMRENASGWIVKILFAIIIIVFVFAFGMSGLNSSGDPTVATVNGQAITRAEYEAMYQRAAENLRRTNPDLPPAQTRSPEFKQMVLGELISQKLLLGEAAKLGIRASDKEVAAGIGAVDAFKDANGNFDQQRYQTALRDIRMTPGDFEENYRRDLTMEKVKDAVGVPADLSESQARQIFDWLGETAAIDYIEVLPTDFRNEIKIGETEIEAYYQANQDRFQIPAQVTLRTLAFTPASLAKFQTVTDDEIKAYYAANKDSLEEPAQVHARHILVAVKESDSQADQEKAKARIDKLYQEAKAGADFAELAKKNSDGPSAPNGGDLGWFGKGAMIPDFEKAAFALNKGGVSEPVRTQFGWHIIMVEDKKEGTTKTFDEAKDEIKARLAEEKASDQANDLLDQATDRLVSGMSLTDIASELGLETVTTDPMPAQFLGQAFGMNADAAKAVSGLTPGQAYKSPVAVNGGYMLVEKVEDIAPSIMALNLVRQTIVNTLENQKGAELAGQEAEKIHAALTGPDAEAAAKQYAARIKTSRPFNRQGNIPELGQSEPLTKAAFNAEDNGWFKLVYTMPGGGAVVARLNKRIPAPEKTWEEQKQFWLTQAGQNYRREAVAAFMDDLSKNAQIDITRPDILK
ncbi:PpiC-type peptidyl-prolyl cis-trans isomerase [Pseudodesulfovibrio mercurii]|uniref:Periplasmic chaperone PpiD n=1 Tax=Pseudodesulfovibrio mercurii TaxID=641491 RepID=F0JIT8_9BACT|nr:SurA N-terminal domain-containing protein [Pseudodesulfovibrio mercurii]EGB15837.1 PpiC-type peptidyl-prolyl cis-trans isomerase [Pseudodesulfovibrio mercurii]